MGDTRQIYVDLRSRDRLANSASTSDFRIRLPDLSDGGGIKNVAKVDLGSLEMSNAQLTVEAPENSLFFSEGIVIGDATMEQPYNRITLTFYDQTTNAVRDTHTVTLPATLMPVTRFEDATAAAAAGGTLVNAETSRVVCAQPHGLRNFLSWTPTPHDDRPENRYSVEPILVGAEPGAKFLRFFRSGCFLRHLPFLSAGAGDQTPLDYYGLSANGSTAVAGPGDDRIQFDRRAVASMRVGRSRDIFGTARANLGYVHTPPLHCQELAQLLQHNLTADQAPYTCTFAEGKFTFARSDGALGRFRIAGPASPEGKVISLREVLGFGPNQQSEVTMSNGSVTSNRLTSHPDVNPALMRLRVTPGFYVSPPSLFANSFEAAIQARGNLQQVNASTQHTFLLCQMDSNFNEQIRVPTGIYTPERLQEVVQRLLTDINLVLEHVNGDSRPCDDWVRFTFQSREGFPFLLDFSGSTSQTLARSLGFRGRRYAGRSKYVGEAFPVPASRNVLPCPAPSSLDAGIRPRIGYRTRPPFRYPEGVYTVTGSTPNAQKYTLLTEPENNWAVPNTGSSLNYFNNIDGAGVVDLCTRSLGTQQSYNFREGDVIRMTGFNQEQIHLDLRVGSDGTTTATGTFKDGVEAVVVRDLGGAGYLRPPTVRARLEGTSVVLPVATHLHRGRVHSIELPYTRPCFVDLVQFTNDRLLLTIHGAGVGAYEGYGLDDQGRFAMAPDGAGVEVAIVNATGALESATARVRLAELPAAGSKHVLQVLGGTADDAALIPSGAALAFVTTEQFPPKFTALPDVEVEAPPEPRLTSLSVQLLKNPDCYEMTITAEAPVYVAPGQVVVVRNAANTFLNRGFIVVQIFAADGTTAKTINDAADDRIVVHADHFAGETAFSAGSQTLVSATLYACADAPHGIVAIDSRHPDDRSTTNAYAGWTSTTNSGVRALDAGYTSRVTFVSDDIATAPLDTMAPDTIVCGCRSVQRGVETSAGFVGFRTAVSRYEVVSDLSDVSVESMSVDAATAVSVSVAECESAAVLRMVSEHALTLILVVDRDDASAFQQQLTVGDLVVVDATAAADVAALPSDASCVVENITVGSTEVNIEVNLPVSSIAVGESHTFDASTRLRRLTRRVASANGTDDLGLEAGHTTLLQTTRDAGATAALADYFVVARKIGAAEVDVHIPFAAGTVESSGTSRRVRLALQVAGTGLTLTDSRPVQINDTTNTFYTTVTDNQYDDLAPESVAEANGSTTFLAEPPFLVDRVFTSRWTLGTATADRKQVQLTTTPSGGTQELKRPGALLVYYNNDWNEFGNDGANSGGTPESASFVDLGEGDEILIAGTRRTRLRGDQHAQHDGEHVDGVWTVVRGPRDDSSLRTKGAADEGLLLLSKPRAAASTWSRDYRESSSVVHDYDLMTSGSVLVSRALPSLAALVVAGRSTRGRYPMNETVGLYAEDPGGKIATDAGVSAYAAQRFHVDAMAVDATTGQRLASPTFAPHYKRLKRGSQFSRNADWGVGGFVVRAPAPARCEVVAWRRNEYLVRLQPSQPGFLNRAQYPESNAVSTGPPVTFVGGTLNTEYVGSTAPGGAARATSLVANGDLVSAVFADKTGARIEGNDHVTDEFRQFQVLFAYVPPGRAVAQQTDGGNLGYTDASVRLVLGTSPRHAQDPTKCVFEGQSIALHDFWPFTGTYAASAAGATSTAPGTWRLVATGTGYEVEIAPGPLTLSTDYTTGTTEQLGVAPHVWNSETRAVVLADGSLQTSPRLHFGGAHLYRPSDFEVNYRGDYTAAGTVTASVTTIQEMTTRVGLLTYARYEQNNKFRFLMEYNCNGIDSNRGFRDVTSSGSVVLTFSKVYAPRTEYISRGSDILARDKQQRAGDGDGFLVNGRQVGFTRSADVETQERFRDYQRQYIATRLGLTSDVWGQSLYEGLSQWALDTHPYRIIMLTFDDQPNSSDQVRHVTTVSDVGTNQQRLEPTTVFLKQTLPSAYNVLRFQPSSAHFIGTRNLNVVRVRILNHDLTPHNMHGREVSVSLLFTIKNTLQQ